MPPYTNVHPAPSSASVDGLGGLACTCCSQRAERAWYAGPRLRPDIYCSGDPALTAHHSHIELAHLILTRSRRACFAGSVSSCKHASQSFPGRNDGTLHVPRCPYAAYAARPPLTLPRGPHRARASAPTLPPMAARAARIRTAPASVDLTLPRGPRRARARAPTLPPMGCPPRPRTNPHWPGSTWHARREPTLAHREHVARPTHLSAPLRHRLPKELCSIKVELMEWMDGWMDGWGMDGWALRWSCCRLGLQIAVDAGQGRRIRHAAHQGAREHQQGLRGWVL